MALITGVFIIAISGCTTNNHQHNNEITTKENQHIDPVINHYFEKEPNITKWQMLEDDNRVLFAIHMKQFPRFKRNTFEKKWTKDLEKFFPNKEVVLSSDFKIRYEINQFITNEIESDSKQALEEKVTKLINLLKEET